MATFIIPSPTPVYKPCIQEVSKVEIKRSDSKLSLCLNMIVKDESHIIESTLEKLCAKIRIDYWVICDTGSSDNTGQIIKDFFKKKNIPGELHNNKWLNFGHNRTLALEQAYNKTDLLLIFDADDELVGNINLPDQLLFDRYRIRVGSDIDTRYYRPTLINNRKRFRFKGVIHEFLHCDGPFTETTVHGDYYVSSGKCGNRSIDPDKYLKDAIILQNAYNEAIEANDEFLYMRYAYYCANSYRDQVTMTGDKKWYSEAIKWYKVVLTHPNQWNQESYNACRYLYVCYDKLGEKERGFFYLVESFKYDKERVECLYPLVVHYCCNNMNETAYNYYLHVKDFYENRYLTAGFSNKLFVEPNTYNFHFPYYMIIVADRLKDRNCGIKMYEIIFTKKQPGITEWHIKNLLFNLQFFLPHIPDTNTNFIKLANEYIAFLQQTNVNISSYDFIKNSVYIKSGLELR